MNGSSEPRFPFDKPKLTERVEFRESQDVVDRMATLAQKHPALTVVGAFRTAMRLGLAQLEAMDKEGIL